MAESDNRTSLEKYLDEKRHEFRDSPEDLAELESLLKCAEEIVSSVQELIGEKIESINSNSPYAHIFLHTMIMRVLEDQAP